jgi:hypothetical protein
MRVLLHPLTHSHLTALASSMLRHQAFTGPRASPPIDARYGPFNPSSDSSIEFPVLSLMVGCEYPHLYWLDSDRASQETAILGMLLSMKSRQMLTTKEGKAGKGITFEM